MHTSPTLRETQVHHPVVVTHTGRPRRTGKRASRTTRNTGARIGHGRVRPTLRIGFRSWGDCVHRDHGCRLARRRVPREAFGKGCVARKRRRARLRRGAPRNLCSSFTPRHKRKPTSRCSSSDRIAPTSSRPRQPLSRKRLRSPAVVLSRKWKKRPWSEPRAACDATAGQPARFVAVEEQLPSSGSTLWANTVREIYYTADLTATRDVLWRARLRYTTPPLRILRKPDYLCLIYL